MDVALCERCGQSYFNDTGIIKCPLCLQELHEKINTRWFGSSHDAPAPTSPAEVGSRRREVWELDVQERLERLLKKVPATIAMNTEIVDSVRAIPVAAREDFSDNLNLLLSRLEEHYRWWSKVRKELSQPPDVVLLHDKDFNDKVEVRRYDRRAEEKGEC